MFGISKLFRGDASADLPEDIQAALAVWRATPAPALAELHFHVRYLVLDIATSGTDPDKDRVLSIAAMAVNRAGVLLPGDACYIDFSQQHADPHTVDRQLAAFLAFMAKAPTVVYHVPYASRFLQAIFRARLGVDFQPQWVDLAWLLPAMFEEKAHAVQPLDQWIDLFELEASEGRRDAMENVLILARIFQMLLERAKAKGIDTAAALIEESRASSFLRRTH